MGTEHIYTRMQTAHMKYGMIHVPTLFTETTESRGGVTTSTAEAQRAVHEG